MSPEKRLPLSTLPSRLRAYEEQAFLEFAEEFHAIFYHFFVGRGLPTFEAEDLAADCVVDISMKVAKGKFTESSEGGFFAWVYKLMAMAANDWWRKHYGHSSEPLPEDLAERELTKIDPDTLQIQAIQEALNLLSPEARQIIELYDLGEVRTYKEIGTILGITEENARVRRHRALRSLKNILAVDSRIHLRCSSVKGGK